MRLWPSCSSLHRIIQLSIIASCFVILTSRILPETVFVSPSRLWSIILSFSCVILTTSSMTTFPFRITFSSHMVVKSLYLILIFIIPCNYTEVEALAIPELKGLVIPDHTVMEEHSIIVHGDVLIG